MKRESKLRLFLIIPTPSVYENIALSLRVVATVDKDIDKENYCY